MNNFLTILLVLPILVGCGKPEDPGMDQPKPTPPVISTATPGSPAGAQVPVAVVVPPEETTPPAPVEPDPVVKQFLFYNSPGICDALKNWNSDTEILVIPQTGGNYHYWVISKDGVTVTSDSDGTNGAPYLQALSIDEAGAINNPPVCTWTIANGQFTGVI